MITPQDARRMAKLGFTPDQIAFVVGLIHKSITRSKHDQRNASVTERNDRRNGDVTDQRNDRNASKPALRMRKYRKNKKNPEISSVIEKSDPVIGVTQSVTVSVTQNNPIMIENDPSHIENASACVEEIPFLLTPTEGSKKVSKEDPKKNNKKKVKSITYSDQFEEFWREYPAKHGSKLRAFESYQQHVNGGTSHETIILGVRAYAAFLAVEGTELQFVAHGATWLNQRRWEADYTAAEGVLQRRGNGHNGGHHTFPGGNGHASRGVDPGKSAQASAAIDQAFSEMEAGDFLRSGGA